MHRNIPSFLALLCICCVISPGLAQLAPPEDTPSTAPAPATRPARKPSVDGELFPDIATPSTRPKPSPPPLPPTTRPAPQPPKPPPAVPASHPAPPSFTPTHRITLTTGRVINGIPTQEATKTTIKMEAGSISVDNTQIQKIEKLEPPK